MVSSKFKRNVASIHYPIVGTPKILKLCEPRSKIVTSFVFLIKTPSQNILKPKPTVCLSEES